MTKAESARLNGKKGGRPRKAAPSAGLSTAKTTTRKPPGRPKGVPNVATREMKEASRLLVEDPAGWAKLVAQYRSGKLHPSVLQMLAYYAYGKPRESMTLEGEIRQHTTIILKPREPKETHAER